jgi:DNA-binding MarR family transcriptional regulator
MQTGIETQDAASASGLAFWHAAIAGRDRIEPAALARMTAHPRFVEACLMSWQGSQALFQRDPLLGRSFKDISLGFFAVFAMWLDLNGELTLSAIQSFCIQHDLASPGRVAALMTQLRKNGYVEPHPAHAGGRKRRYTVTPTMIASFREIFRTELTALSLMEPVAGAVADRLAEPALFAPFLTAMGLGMANIAKHKVWSPVTLFAERNGGSLILAHIAASAGPGDSVPPRRPVPLSIAALARQFRVSRSHILRLLRDAEKLNLLRRHPDGTITLEEKLREALLYYQAVNFMGHAACAHVALLVAGAASSAGRPAPIPVPTTS